MEYEGVLKKKELTVAHDLLKLTHNGEGFQL